MNCAICGRDIPGQFREKHHLVPRSKKGKETVDVCADCGNQIHNLFTNNELRDSYDTLGKLKAHPAVRKWVKWVRNRSFGVCHKTKKRR